MAVSAWTGLPEIIPIHFNLRGELDGYGSKNTVLFLLPVMAFLYVMLTIAARYPHVYNYLVEITEENAAAQYKLAVRLVRTLKLEVMGLFTALEYFIIRSGTTHQLGAAPVFMMLGLLAVAATACIFLFQSKSAE
jgi:uncharacterized membrane protein